MTVRPRIDAERALERALTNPAYEAALRDAYRGRHDVLDALWWAAHPLTDSARGLPDPAVEHRLLQRAAYARASDPAQANENLRRLQEAEHQLIDDAQLLADAVEAADRHSDPEPDEPDDVELDSAPPPRRKLLLPVVAGVALLAAIMLLPSLMQLEADADPKTVSTAQPAERVKTDITTMGAQGRVANPLAIFERPQTGADDLGMMFGEVLVADSTRALPDFVPHAKLYLARGQGLEGSEFDEGELAVCLVAIHSDGSGMSTCASEESFAVHGLSMGGSGRYPIGNDQTVLTESFDLQPTGDFSYEATVRVTGRSAFLGPDSGAPADLD